MCVHFFQLHREKWNCWVRSLKMLPSGFCCCCCCVCVMLPVFSLWYWCLNSDLHLLGRHATFCVVTPIALLVFFFFWNRVWLFAQADLDHDPFPLIYDLHSSLDERHESPHSVFFCWEGVSQTFCPGWPGILILLNSASCIAGMIEIQHHTQVLIEMGSC
jgi:hypothetical protein